MVKIYKNDRIWAGSGTARPLVAQGLMLEILFVCFVALCPKLTAMVMAGRSVHLSTLLPGQA